MHPSSRLSSIWSRTLAGKFLCACRIFISCKQSFITDYGSNERQFREHYDFLIYRLRLRACNLRRVTGRHGNVKSFWNYAINSTCRSMGWHNSGTKHEEERGLFVKYFAIARAHSRLIYRRRYVRDLPVYFTCAIRLARHSVVRLLFSFCTNNPFLR